MKLPSTKKHIGGTDFAFLDASQLGIHIVGCQFGDGGCVKSNTFDVHQSVSINWAGVFQTADDLGLFNTTIPPGTKYLYGVHWAIEAYEGELNIGISRMQTYSAE